MQRGSKDYEILDFSVTLGKKLGLAVVAEGAETPEDMRLLTDVGADVVQGYYVSRPMAAGDVVPWSREWKQKRAAGAGL